MSGAQGLDGNGGWILSLAFRHFQAFQQGFYDFDLLDPQTSRKELRWRLLGGSWVVISRVTILITHIRGLITPLITTHEPPSMGP